MSNRAVEFIIRAKNLMGQGVNGAIQQLGRLKSAGLAIGSAMGTALKAGAVGGFAALTAAAGLVGMALKKAFEFERYQTQFTVLFKSVDKAKAHIQQLSAFAAATPFEMPEIAQASRQLHVFTGGVMGGVASLKLVGDAAAASGASIGEVSMWVGRSYSMIKNGKPFGEAALRLQELGLLSGEARTKMETLTEAGASSAEVWQVLQDELAKNEGGMKNLSTTGEGLMSTLKDDVNLAVADLGKTFLELAKDGIATAIAWIDRLRDSGAITEWAGKAVKAIQWVGGALGKVKGWVQDAGAWVGGAVAGIEQATMENGGGLKGYLKANMNGDNLRGALAGGREGVKGGREARADEAKKLEAQKQKNAQDAAAKQAQVEKAAAEEKAKIQADLLKADQDRLNAAKKKIQDLLKADPYAKEALVEARKKGLMAKAGTAAGMEKVADFVERERWKKKEQAEDRAEKDRERAKDKAARLEEKRQGLKEKARELQVDQMTPEARLEARKKDLGDLVVKYKAAKDPEARVDLATKILDAQKGVVDSIQEVNQAKKPWEASMSVGEAFTRAYGQDKKQDPAKETAANTARLVAIMEEIRRKGGGLAD